MRILVTGGAGFIGSHIVEHFQGKAEVRVLDNLRSGYRENLQGLEHEFIEGSITDRAAVKEAVEGIDYLFHMAAMISVPESMEKPLECVEINTTGTLVVLEEAAKAEVKKMCFSSSAANYGDNPEVPKVETMLSEPKSPYAITKLDGEFYCDMFTREGKIDTGVMRYFNVFGRADARLYLRQGHRRRQRLPRHESDCARLLQCRLRRAPHDQRPRRKDYRADRLFFGNRIWPRTRRRCEALHGRRRKNHGDRLPANIEL